MKFTRAMLVLFPLAKAFTLRGGDIEALLARNGIPLGALTDPTMLVDASACYSAMEDMAETLGDPYFGAKVAIETAKKGTPAFRDSVAHARNLGDFLSRVVVEVSKQVDWPISDLQKACVTPHVAQKSRYSAIDGRTTRHQGYDLSIKHRKRIEEAFGWAKTVGGMAQIVYRGVERVRSRFILTMEPNNPARLTRLLAA